jgi:uncharacterized protein with HEPN domain
MRGGRKRPLKSSHSGFLMKAHRVRLRLIEICEEISGIQSPTRGADLAQFSSSRAMKRAAEHALLIIAEAAKHIPRAMKDTRPEVPWHKIHGLSNLLRHEYRHISIPKYCGR